MKSIAALLITVLASSTAFAARSGDAELKCNYVVATTTKAARDITIIPAETRGEIILKLENGVYKAELTLGEQQQVTVNGVKPGDSFIGDVNGGEPATNPNNTNPATTTTAPDLKVNFEATIAAELNLSVKVTEVRFSSTNILVSTTSIHKPDASGVFAGSQIVRNPDVETLALRNNIDFSAAALSESLPSGLSFIGAMISCN